MERQPEYPPEYDMDTPCLICGQDCDDCPCPECPECGEKGSPGCYPEHAEKHGFVAPLHICPTCKGQKITMPDPEYGGDPGICNRCQGKGQVLCAYPRQRSLGIRMRELTKEEERYEALIKETNKAAELLMKHYCVVCEGHGHTIQTCPRRSA